MSLRSSWSCSNGTCTEKLEPYQTPLSSTFALSLLSIVLITVVGLSLTTHHCQKGKMMKRKIQRAQEEYEKDQSSLVPPENADRRHCVIARTAPGHTGLQAPAGHTGTSSPLYLHLDAGHRGPYPPPGTYPAAGQTETAPSLDLKSSTGSTNNLHPATHIIDVDRGELEAVAVS